MQTPGSGQSSDDDEEEEKIIFPAAKKRRMQKKSGNGNGKKKTGTRKIEGKEPPKFASLENACKFEKKQKK